MLHCYNGGQLNHPSKRWTAADNILECSGSFEHLYQHGGFNGAQRSNEPYDLECKLFGT